MKKRVILLVSVILLTAILTPAVFADMGPKDSLTVYLENPPDELYYLDLLYETERDQVYPNLTEEELASLNADMLNAIRDNKFGLKAALTDGTGIPTFGSLMGKADGLCMKHTFGYYGLPDTYRIIIVTESGKTHVSEEYTRKAMQSSITYDYRSGTAEIPPLWTQYALQFLYTFFMTLIIEGTIFLLFRFSLRRDGAVFLGVNFATQIILTVFVGHAMIMGGTVNSFIRLLVCEPFILIAESAAFAFLLKDHTRARRIGFGTAANLISWIAGMLTNGILYSIIVRIA